ERLAEGLAVVHGHRAVERERALLLRALDEALGAVGAVVEIERAVVGRLAERSRGADEEQRGRDAAANTSRIHGADIVQGPGVHLSNGNASRSARRNGKGAP